MLFQQRKCCLAVGELDKRIYEDRNRLVINTVFLRFLQEACFSYIRVALKTKACQVHTT